VNVTVHDPVSGRAVPERCSTTLRADATGDVGEGSVQATMAEPRSATDEIAEAIDERMRTSRRWRDRDALLESAVLPA
jgi:hypothetical protein